MFLNASQVLLLLLRIILFQVHVVIATTKAYVYHDLASITGIEVHLLTLFCCQLLLVDFFMVNYESHIQEFREQHKVLC